MSCQKYGCQEKEWYQGRGYCYDHCCRCCVTGTKETHNELCSSCQKEVHFCSKCGVTYVHGSGTCSGCDYKDRMDQEGREHPDPIFLDYYGNP